MHLAIMPARGGSKRIKNKNIVDFCGQPLLAYALQAARQSDLFDHIHVSTEDAAIADVAGNLGFMPEFLRDPALADDHTPLLPVLRWVLERFVERGRHFDSVCLLMPTAPLIEAEDLRQAHALFERHGRRRPVLAMADFPCPVEWAFRLDPDDSLVPCQPGMANVRSQDLPKAYYDSGTFIFFPAADILAPTHDDPGYLGYALPRHKAVDIDTLEDLELAAILHRGLKAGMAVSAAADRDGS